MSARFRIWPLAIVLVQACSLFPATASWSEATNWPVVPVNADHPVGNTLGELLVNPAGEYYQHGAIDVLVTPYPAVGAPDVVATAGGFVDRVNLTENGNDNFVRIVAEDGVTRHNYLHLEYLQLSGPLQLLANETSSDPSLNSSRALYMAPGERISKVHEVFACDKSHLHYGIDRKLGEESVLLLNPLKNIEPKPDPDKPEVKNVFVAKQGDGQWNILPGGESPGECTVVKGNVSVIAEIRDRDDAGFAIAGENDVGIYRVQWRACPNSAPDCDWTDAYLYDTMQGDWTDPVAEAMVERFSLKNPWITTTESWLRLPATCPLSVSNQDGALSRTFMVLTSPSASGLWKTSGNGNRNGDYTLSVKASDIAGNISIASVPICVQN